MKTNTTISAALATIKNAQADLQGQIAATRAEEERCVVQLDRLRSMPISVDDFSIYLREHILFLGREWFASRSPRSLLTGRMGDTPMNRAPWSNYEDDGEIKAGKNFMPDFGILQGGSDFGAMCFVMPEAVHEKLMAGYRETIGKKWGSEDLPTVEQRRASLIELSATLEACQAGRAALEGELMTLSGGFAGAREAKPAPANAGPMTGQRLANPDLVSQR